MSLEIFGDAGARKGKAPTRLGIIFPGPSADHVLLHFTICKGDPKHVRLLPKPHALRQSHKGVYALKYAGMHYCDRTPTQQQ